MKVSNDLTVSQSGDGVFEVSSWLVKGKLATVHGFEVAPSVML